MSDNEVKEMQAAGWFFRLIGIGCILFAVISLGGWDYSGIKIKILFLTLGGVLIAYGQRVSIADAKLLKECPECGQEIRMTNKVCPYCNCDLHVTTRFPGIEN